MPQYSKLRKRLCLLRTKETSPPKRKMEFIVPASDVGVALESATRRSCGELCDVFNEPFAPEHQEVLLQAKRVVGDLLFRRRTTAMEGQALGDLKRFLMIT